MYEKYEGPVENSIELQLENLEDLIKGDYNISKRSIALLLMQDDADMLKLVERSNQDMASIKSAIAKIKSMFSNPATYEIAVQRQREVNDILSGVISYGEENVNFSERLSLILMKPLTGIPILIAVIYWGIYKLVGGFGAGVLVDFLDISVFEKFVMPFLNNLVNEFVKFQAIKDLLIGEYGVLNVAIKYSFTLVLPVVSVFFFVFSIIEDSGYLPRIAMLIDRLFKAVGLSGRAVIPMTIGFGCGSVATIATRTLPTVKERVISTLLLALAVPCSAQLGVIMAVLGKSRKAFFLWFAFMLFIFAVVGYLSSKIIKGERPSFYMEIPPLRFPNLQNTLYKTYVRVIWYIKEVLPVFIIASVILWALNIFNIFNMVISLLEKPVELAGLPVETAKIFVFGFFRRDYGAVGLYDLSARGILNMTQLTVACTALTLFIPCVAQFMIMIRERGIRAGVIITALVLLFSFTAAYVMNKMILFFNIM